MAKRNKKSNNKIKLGPVKPQTKSPENEIEAKLNAAIQGTTDDLNKVIDSIPEESIEVVLDEVESSNQSSTVAELDEPPSQINSPGESVDLPKMLKEINLAKQDLIKAVKVAESRERAARNAEQKSVKTHEAYEEKVNSLKDSEEDLTQRGLKLSEGEELNKLEIDKLDVGMKDLLDKEESLISREADADAGFVSRRTQMLAALEDEMNSYASKLAEHGEQMTRVRSETLAEIEAERDKVESSKQIFENSHKEQERTLQSKLRDAQWLKEDLEEEKNSWSERLDLRVQELGLEFREERRSTEETIKDLENKLDTAHKSMRVVGNQDPTQMVRDIESLNQQNQQLADELAQRPTLVDSNINQQLQDRINQYKSELDRFQKENQALTLREGKSAMGVAELENLRDQRSSWEVREQALKANIEELKSDLGQYVEQSKNKEVFPECCLMDKEEDLQEANRLLEKDSIDLKSLVSYARNQIAHKKLYYQEKDLRAYVAGLATTRLHILQGISGTGKTSLPREFAKIMGWGFDLVEVQAGWRDRQDLLGYYNSFEHKFYESPFLQAMYKAMTPKYEGVPVFIVLDEMNLSHPEHYFADFLSAIEQDQDEQSVPLLSSRLKGGEPPKLLLDEGKRISVPPNVWFIGTANQDETTKDFADKTYDRANVQEFPKQPEKFIPKNQKTSGKPLSINSLQIAFEQATEKYADLATEAIDILNAELTGPLHELGIGWGNRLEAQMERYIPVLIACGGSIGEGLDNLVAHKLLRKIKGRFDLSSESLASLSQQLINIWDTNPALKDSFPEKSLEILEIERKRLGHQD